MLFASDNSLFMLCTGIRVSACATNIFTMHVLTLITHSENH